MGWTSERQLGFDAPLTRFFVLLALTSCDGAKAIVVDAGASAAIVVDASTVVEDAQASSELDASSDADIDIDAIAEQGMVMIEEASTLIQTNQIDCEKMGARLDEYYTKNRATIDFIKTTYAKLSKAERKPVQVKYRPRFDVAWKKLQPGLKKCKQQRQLKELLDKAQN